MSHFLIEFFQRLYNFEDLIRWGGDAVLVAIVFAENGIMAGFFLPGDSLLVTAGLLAASGLLSLPRLLTELSLAAILGEAMSYYAGQYMGPKIFNKEDSLLFHKNNLLRAHRFYEKYGAKTVVIARFMPIVRTFAPIVAGVGRMKYATFTLYNLIGGTAWVCSMLLTGFYLGRAIPNVDRHIHKIILLVIFLSVLPAIIQLINEKRQARRALS